ncbi:MAG: hypothetical protein JNJ50_32180 [Acidobacteria bacterium]|nr:hypothetical protein [Acidobacteriota bacterium]
MAKFHLHFFCLALLLAICAALPAQAQIQFDRPKSDPPLDNPYTMSIPREKILESVREVLKTCSVQLDEALSKPNEGKLVTKPIIFTKGVTTKTDLEYLATFPAVDVRNWVQGRYTLEIAALPLDQKRSQLAVTAIIQGRISDPLTPNKWIDGQSNGRLEDEALRGLAGKILGVDMSLKTTRPTRRIFNCEY